MDGEVTDIAAGEDDRIDHVGVGGEGEASGGLRQHRGVVLVALGDAGEGRDDQLVEQLVAELAAAAVAEQDDVGFHDGE